MIDEQPNKTALDFLEVLSGVMKKLSPDELLYWSRSEDALFEKLKLGDIEFVTEFTEQAVVIPSLAEEEFRSVWKRTPLRNLHQGQITTECQSKLRQSYPATQARSVMPYSLVCRMSLQEIKNFVQGDLSHSVLTMQQISYLLQEQNHRGRSGPLSFDSNNYVLLEGKNGDIVPALVFWKKSKEYPHAKNAWDFWLQPNISGRILLAV